MNNLYLDAHCAIHYSTTFLSQPSPEFRHGGSSHAQHVPFSQPFLQHALFHEPSSPIATCSPCSSSAIAAILRSASKAGGSRTAAAASCSAEGSPAHERHKPRQPGYEAHSHSDHGRLLQEAKCSPNPRHAGIQNSYQVIAAHLFRNILNSARFKKMKSLGWKKYKNSCYCAFMAFFGHFT
jgi:hypothetical protein